MSGAQGLRDHANYKGETECLLIHKVIMQKSFTNESMRNVSLSGERGGTIRPQADGGK